ncbi:MAG: alkaline phosphatase family protein, partial [Arenicella sp.]|nr:alkaline phosphatase family protein [Arenicella sp.]
LLPQAHGILTNAHQSRVKQPDIFSQVTAAGRQSAAVAHSYFSTFFQQAPFDPLRDLEVDHDARNIQFARFYTMTGETVGNPVLPSDFDLFTQASILMQRHSPDYVLIHSSSPDSMNHVYGPQSIQTDTNTYQIDSALSHYIPLWQKHGYDIMITADHGHSDRGHHGGTSADMRDVAFYYFGNTSGPAEEVVLCQTQIAPSVLELLGVEVPSGMESAAFWQH